MVDCESEVSAIIRIISVGSVEKCIVKVSDGVRETVLQR